MILLRLISLPYVRKHLLRTVLTLTGIALGVAVYVGMHTANQSVLYAFNRTVDRIAGATQLQVSAGEAGFPEEILERVQAVEGVRVAVPVIEAVVTSPLPGAGNLLVLGVDMTGDRSLREYDLESGEAAIIDDPLVFLAQPDSLIVTTRFAEQHRLQTGSRVPMQTMEGRKEFVIRGVMKSEGLASAFGGSLAIMDVYAAQMMFGRGRTIDRVDVGVHEGTDVEAVRRRIQEALGSTYLVEPPSARGQQFEAMSRVYGMTANLTSLFALFIGLFIIFNTFSIAVTQRRSEIGILRALGATAGQIRTLFLMEGACIGLAGSIVGLLAGIMLARGVAGYIGGLFAEIYGVGERAEELTADPALLWAAVSMGLVTSVIAAIVPARNAARIDPVKALQKGAAQSISAGENRLRRTVAIAAAAAAVALLSLATQRSLLYAGYLLAILAAVLLSPTATLLLSRTLRPLLRFVSPVEGTLAADSLIQSPRRTSGTVAALMLSLALVIGLGGLAKASYMSITEWMNNTLNPDLFVAASESPTRRSFRFPASMGAQLAEVPGVELVQPIRSGRIQMNGKPVMLTAGDVRSLQQRTGMVAIAGSAEDMVARTAAGTAAMVSENFALLNGYSVGDTLELPSPSGILRLPVAGIIADYSDQQGNILIDRGVYMRHWKDESVNIFRVYLQAGQEPESVKQLILERFTGQTRMFVMTNRELKAFIMRLTDQWFGLTYVQIAVAVLVAILGIVNTLTVSITDRRRELGVLQAVGAVRNQVRRTIWLEALAVATIGVVLGLAFGAVQLYYSLTVTARDFAGFRLTYEYPFGIAAALFPLIFAAAFLASLGPAESALRGSLVEALEYE